MELSTIPAEMSLKELVELCARLLAERGIEPSDGRANAAPDARTVRYYVSLGLVDRPLGYRGTSALYGRRHALQILAIKALQAQGRGLTEVQAALLGRSDAFLAAQIPSPAPVTQLTPTPAPAGAWSLELSIAPGVRVSLSPEALATLDPGALAHALQAVLTPLTPAAPVPPEEETP